MEETDNMTCIRFTEILLFLLFLNHVCTEKPTDDFRAEGENFVIGYCFGVDYIAVYRSAPEGDQLLGNSSNIHLLNLTLPADLHGRVHFTEDHLLGLRISNLTKLDSGIYRRECWDNKSLVSQHTKQLSVCKKEIFPKEIIVNEEGGAELFCNDSSIGRAGVSVRWYLETLLVDNPVLFLDSSISLKPLIQEGAVEARNNGAVLVLDKTMLKNNLQFYCLVIEGENCLSFQNMYQTDSSETRYSYASEGDRVVLQCNADGNQQKWETPLGEINSITGKNKMYISTVESDFSLIIPAAANEHSGMYSCISSSLEIQYSLLLCPKMTSQEKLAEKGQNVSLECSFTQDASHRVLWYRRVPSGQYEVFSDSEDHSIPIPEDLKEKLSLSHFEYVLEISDLDMKDAGVYGCVLLTSPGFIDGNHDDYNDTDEGDYTDYTTGDTTEDYYGQSDFFESSEKCIFKQETVLKIVNKTQPRDDPSKSTDVTMYAVVAGLVVLVVLVAVVVVYIVKKRRRAASETNIEMQSEDAACKESLTGNQEP